MARVGIIGGGISGLTAAHRLHRQGVSVQLFEASPRIGGVIETTKSEGFLVEHGPNSLRPTEPLEETIDDLGLTSERVWSDNTASTRYVVRNGQPQALPTSVGSFLTTDLFSARAKLRLLAEPFIAQSPEGAEESLAAFTRRRLGPEVLNYAVAPFVGGVFAGRPDQLSARHAFEKLVRLEQEHGSLFWGAVRSGGSDSSVPDDAPSSLFSFREGLETLPKALAAELGDALQRNAPVTALERDDGQWAVTANAPSGPIREQFDAVVCTVPLHALDNFDFAPAVPLSPLREVDYPPVHVVALGYPRDAVAHPLDGFGMLVPPVEDRFDVLGTIFSSTLFPNRAPADHVLLTTFVGGARNPTLAEQPPSHVQSVVERDLSRLLGVDDAPTFSQHVHWPQAIPQYTLGYGHVKDTLDALESQHDGLFFAGNYREGVSVGDAMSSGASAATQVLRTIRGSA